MAFNDVRDRLAAGVAFANNIDASSGTNWPPPGEHKFWVKSVDFEKSDLKWKKPEPGSVECINVIFRCELEEPLPGEKKPCSWPVRYSIVTSDPLYNGLPEKQKERVNISLGKLKGAYSVVLGREPLKDVPNALAADLEALEEKIKTRPVLVKGLFVSKKDGEFTNRDTYFTAVISD